MMTSKRTKKCPKKPLTPSYCPGIFGFIILDESQKIKGPLTITFRSVKKLDIPRRLLLTATAMVNRPTDLIGTLTLFWKEEWETRAPEDLSIEDYEKSKPALVGKMSCCNLHLRFLSYINITAVTSPSLQHTISWQHTIGVVMDNGVPSS